MDITNVTPLPDISDASSAKARQLQQQAKSGSGLTEKQRQQAKKVSQDFESLMVNMMIKSMRTTVGKDSLTGGGHGEEVFRSMLDQEYASASVKRGGGLGLAKTIEKEIIRQESRKVTPTLDHRE
jgi:flagellar protein FlgJ